MILPIYIEKYNIYDILYNDNNELVIIQPMVNLPLVIKLGTLVFTVYSCTHKHTYVYKLSTTRQHIITLNINGDDIVTKINTYPSFKNLIIMSTIVKHEDNIICNWIEHHKLLGIQKFIIYDNSNDNTLEDTLQNYSSDIVLIKWIYPFYFNISGISGQTTQLNHSIHTFQQSKYIGFFDVDEYINPQHPYTNIDTIFNHLIQTKNIKNSGGFRLLSRPFYNTTNRSDTQFLSIFTCSFIKYIGCFKMFIKPKNVNIISNHVITLGNKIFKVKSPIMYFNHYMYLNKPTRNRCTLFFYYENNSIEYLYKRLNNEHYNISQIYNKFTITYISWLLIMIFICIICIVQIYFSKKKFLRL